MENVEKNSSDPEVSNPESQGSEEGHVEEGQRPKGKEVFKASKRHLELSDIIKSLHDDLRESSKTFGVEKAWEEHLKNESALEEYANAMKELAEIWENNANHEGSRSISRIRWTAASCYAYFFKDLYLVAREKEERISFVSESRRIPIERLLPDKMVALKKSLKVLDVGSCFNPFSTYSAFDLTAIDLYPADDSVYRADFLKVELEDDFRINGRDMEALPKDYFHAVIFSFLLEYMPSSEQRIKCCKKAYELLKYEGILIIITPDSQHVGKNVKLMKNWKYTLGKLGFRRIKFVKLPHVTCLMFRKCLDADVAERWGDISFEPGMTLSLDIPQDKESEIATCLDITKDKEIEETVSSMTLYDKESKREPSLDIVDQPDETPKLENPQDETSPSRISWTYSICEEYFSQIMFKQRKREEDYVAMLGCNEELTDSLINKTRRNNFLLNNEKKKLLQFSFKRTVDDYIKQEEKSVKPYPEIFEDDVSDDMAEKHESYEVTYHSIDKTDLRNNFEKSYEKEYYHCVVVSNLIFNGRECPNLDGLECCRQASLVLKHEGILVLTTLDSGKMRNDTDLLHFWRCQIADMGFMMIEFRKLRNLVCLVFRKSIHIGVANCELLIYDEPTMIEYKCP